MSVFCAMITKKNVVGNFLFSFIYFTTVSDEACGLFFATKTRTHKDWVSESEREDTNHTLVAQFPCSLIYAIGPFIVKQRYSCTDFLENMAFHTTLFTDWNPLLVSCFICAIFFFSTTIHSCTLCINMRSFVIIFRIQTRRS